MDIWDGPGNEPIVYHGFTLTSRIQFVDILKLIKSQGFHASEYPVILSLENHCSKKVLEKVASYLKEVFGDMLVRAPKNCSTLPSPESLKNKVIVKGKAMKPGTVVTDSNIVDEDSDEDDEDEDEELKKKAKSNPKQHTSKVIPELSELTFLQTAHFKDWETVRTVWNANNMASFGENKTFKKVTNDVDILNFRGVYNSKCLSRIYPKGSRVDSSNFNPILPWNAGCQLVALNYQTASIPLFINFAKFQENGNVGYNLKPDFKSLPVSRPFEGEKFCRPKSNIQRIKVKIHGARLLPQVSRVDIMDPFVRVEVNDGGDRPVFIDQTEFIDDNAFNPDFQKGSFNIPIRDSMNSFITFSVFDKDVGKDDFVAQWTAPVECLRSGLRCLKLLNSNFDVINRGMCHVLVSIEIEK